jgi:hypothetical protein
VIDPLDPITLLRALCQLLDLVCHLQPTIKVVGLDELGCALDGRGQGIQSLQLGDDIKVEVGVVALDGALHGRKVGK